MASSAMARDEHASSATGATTGTVTAGGEHHPAHLATVSSADPDGLDSNVSGGDAFDGDTEERVSLKDDLSSLYQDSRTYLQAELAFQKSRARFVGAQSGKLGIYGAAALAFVHLALIALAVGAVLALETLVGPLAATLIVALVLLVLAGVCVYLLRSKLQEMKAALSEDGA